MPFEAILREVDHLRNVLKHFPLITSFGRPSGTWVVFPL